MIRLRYPIGLGIAAGALAGFSVVLVYAAADALERVVVTLLGPGVGQPAREDFVVYSVGYHLRDLLVQLVPWVVLAAALTGIAALVLAVLRSRQRQSLLSDGGPLEPR